MSRPIPRRALPHVNAVTVEPVTGGSAAGRAYGAAVTLHRTLIVDGVSLTGTQYEREAEVSGVVYCDRDAIATIPPPDSRVTLWKSTTDEHQAFVKRVERYHHPKVGDVLVVVLR